MITDVVDRQHAVILTCISLAGAAEPAATGYLGRCLEELDEALDDACARFRYPRRACPADLTVGAQPKQVTTAVAK
jgi:hypothetical protein